MNKTTKRLLFAVLILLLFLLTVYFVLAFYYREGFSLNTWINGVYCTGKTVEEVNSELLSHTEAPDVVIVDKAGEKYTIWIIARTLAVHWKRTDRNRIRICGWTMFCFIPGGPWHLR